MAPLEGMCSADNSGGVSMVRGHRGALLPLLALGTPSPPHLFGVRGAGLVLGCSLRAANDAGGLSDVGLLPPPQWAAALGSSVLLQPLILSTPCLFWFCRVISHLINLSCLSLWGEGGPGDPVVLVTLWSLVQAGSVVHEVSVFWDMPSKSPSFQQSSPAPNLSLAGLPGDQTPPLPQALLAWHPAAVPGLPRVPLGDLVGHPKTDPAPFPPAGPRGAPHRSRRHHGPRDRPQLWHEPRQPGLLRGGHPGAGRLRDGSGHRVRGGRDGDRDTGTQGEGQDTATSLPASCGWCLQPGSLTASPSDVFYFIFFFLKYFSPHTCRMYIFACPYLHVHVAVSGFIYLLTLP